MTQKSSAVGIYSDANGIGFEVIGTLRPRPGCKLWNPSVLFPCTFGFLVFMRGLYGCSGVLLKFRKEEMQSSMQLGNEDSMRHFK